MRKAVYLLILSSCVIALLLVFGKKTLSNEIIINAPVDAVWKKFSNFSEYPRWNPFIKKISGDVDPGKRIHVTIQPKDREAMIFNPVILIYEKNKTLQWEGRLFLPGIFTGRHTFQLQKIDNNKTKFTQKEDFNGILVPFIDLNPTLSGFKSMNESLKKLSEK